MALAKLKKEIEDDYLLQLEESLKQKERRLAVAPLVEEMLAVAPLVFEVNNIIQLGLVEKFYIGCTEKEGLDLLDYFLEKHDRKIHRAFYCTNPGTSERSLISQFADRSPGRQGQNNGKNWNPKAQYAGLLLNTDHNNTKTDINKTLYIILYKA